MKTKIKKEEEEKRESEVGEMPHSINCHHEQLTEIQTMSFTCSDRNCYGLRCVPLKLTR